MQSWEQIIQGRYSPRMIPFDKDNSFVCIVSVSNFYSFHDNFNETTNSLDESLASVTIETGVMDFGLN